MAIQYVIGGIAVGVAALGIGSFFAWKKWKKEIKRFFLGKNILILGGIETGKTTLNKFLREGEIVTKHIATTRKKKVKGKNFKLNELSFKIREGQDVSGQDDFIKDWKTEFKNCDICFYMFDCSKVYNHDKQYIEKINSHLTFISDWSLEYSPTILLIGSFADKIEEFLNSNNSNIQEFEQKIRTLIKKGQNKVKASSSDVFIGSLKNRQNIVPLVYNILTHLKN